GHEVQDGFRLPQALDAANPRTCAHGTSCTACATGSEGGPFMAKAVIVSAARTAIGTLGGALAQQPATKLGAIAVREAIQRAKLSPEQVDEVILGHVLPAGLGLNPARVAQVESGVPKEKTAYGVNKACGSGGRG